MFPESEVFTLIKLTEQLDPLKDKLDAYCDEVAKHLDFDFATDIMLSKSKVNFMAEWHGAYQSCNRDAFCFPIENLLNSPEETAKAIKAKMANHEPLL